MSDELPKYEEEFLMQIKKNHLLVLRQLEEKEKGMMDKINTFSNRSGFSQKDIVRKIKKDNLLKISRR